MRLPLVLILAGCIYHCTRQEVIICKTPGPFGLTILNGIVGFYYTTVKEDPYFDRFSGPVEGLALRPHIEKFFGIGPFHWRIRPPTIRVPAWMLMLLAAVPVFFLQRKMRIMRGILEIVTLIAIALAISVLVFSKLALLLV